MIIKLIRIKNDLLRKFSNFKEILKIFEKIEKIVQILQKFFKMSIFAYYFQIIFLTNYVSYKIEGHVPSQSTAAKMGGGARAHKAPRSAYVKAPPDFKG